MGLPKVLWRSLLLVLLLVGCSSAAAEIPVTVEVTREVPVTVQVMTEVEVTKEVRVTVQVTQEVQVSAEPTTTDTAAPIPETEVRTLQSSEGGRDYRIYVSLPQSYSKNPSKNYPVVYLLDANVLFELTKELCGVLHWAGQLRELMIVGIGYPTDNIAETYALRERDYTPTTVIGEAGEFLKFIQEDLIPHIDSNYRTNPSDRAIVGHSHGGLFSLYALFEAPNTFNRYVVSSPSLWWDDRVILEYEREYAQEHPDLPVKLFLSVGGLEEDAMIRGPNEKWVSNLEEFHSILEDRSYAGLEMEMVILADEDHLAVIPSALSRGLRTVYR
jgi:predicted alpha/beta superfamily hydrolase